MSKKVIVTGASGFLGIRVCSELHRKGYVITAVIRKTSVISSIEPYVDQFIICDLSIRDEVNKLIKNIKGSGLRIISLAGSVDYRQDYISSRLSNVETARNIVDASIKLQADNRLDRLIFIGSVASRGFIYFTDKTVKLINEETDFYDRGVSLYSDVKYEAESLVKEAIVNIGLRAIIIEPGSLVGKRIRGRKTTNSGLIEKILNGYPVLAGGASYSSVYRVAEGIVLALERGRIGECYLFGGENMKMRDLAFHIKLLKRKYFPAAEKDLFPLVVIPASVASILGRLKMVINREQALLGSSFHYIDHSKADRDLGYNHTHADLDFAIQESIEDIYRS